MDPNAIGHLTITIHSVVSTRLFPIALDLLASAFIAGSGHPPSLLQMFRIVQGRALGVGGRVLIIVKVVIVFMGKAGVVFAVKRTRRSSHIA